MASAEVFNMKEQFANEVVVKLIGKIPDEELGIIREAIITTLSNYEIDGRETAMALYESFVPKFYEIYLAQLRINGRSLGTIKTYNFHLINFFVQLQCPLNELTQSDIYRYLYWLQQKGSISNRTLDHIRVIINTFLEWSYANEYIPNNPCKNIPPIKYIEKQREPLTDIELELVRDCCKTYREHAIVEVLYSTGCRVSELVDLKVSDIDFNTKAVTILGKGGKYRVSFISARAELMLRKYLSTRNDNNPSLIVTERKPIRALSKVGLEKIIGDIGERAGLKNRLTPHVLRHTFATNLVKRGAKLEDVQKLLGHEKPSTTMIYTKIDMDKIRFEHERYIL